LHSLCRRTLKRYATSLRGVYSTGLLCAEVRFQHLASDYLLASLPAVLLIRNDSESSWLQHISKMIVNISAVESPMSQAIIKHLSELLFIHVLDHLLITKQVQQGLLALHADPRISKALHAIHAQPEETWSLSILAEKAALSRTLFAQNFKKLSGWTPMQYLTWWRMQLAWDYLRDGSSVTATAELVGYKSTAAFSRAFQNCFNMRAGMVKKY